MFLPSWIDKSNVLLVAVVFLDEMWKTRNELIHEGKNPNKLIIVSSVNRRINEFEAIKKKPIELNATRESPPPGFFKCNVDAAVGATRCMLSCVLRDHNGEVISLHCWHLEASGPLLVESLALSHTIDLATQRS